MATEEEIQAAERAVIGAARRLRPRPSEHVLATALAKLDALQSPLPSRDELIQFVDSVCGSQGEYFDALTMERAGAYWLRWVATQIRGNVGPNQTSDDCDGFADELEARK